MVVDRLVIDGTGYDGDVESRVNRLCDIMSRGSLFFVSFSAFLTELITRSDIHHLKSVQ